MIKNFGQNTMFTVPIATLRPWQQPTGVMHFFRCFWFWLRWKLSYIFTKKRKKKKRSKSSYKTMLSTICDKVVLPAPILAHLLEKFKICQRPICIFHLIEIKEICLQGRFITTLRIKILFASLHHITWINEAVARWTMVTLSPVKRTVAVESTSSTSNIFSNSWTDI